MKLITCDICKRPIDVGNPLWAAKTPLKFNLAPDKPRAAYIEMDSFQFDTTNFDVCHNCVMQAIKSAIVAQYGAK